MIIDESNRHIFSVEVAHIWGKPHKFLHFQTMKWDRELKERTLSLLEKLGECYVVAYLPGTDKFCKKLGARVVREVPDHDPPFKLMRFN